ncbi:glycosyltransferase family 4 protein [Agromyces humatus]|uniref:Glycosyltransferase subfamily 4-like N-terminal domain-containing protein n=1 Tax=Agromyces humatus TaxID=279573 RepID=A0ABN2KQ35_9MICO|nr:glycosyltransferase family 4 protein [Agromyces humatus]
MTRIVQIANRVGPGSGVAGVAWNLEQQFRALGATVERFTYSDARRGKAERPWPTTRWRARLAGGWRQVWFSTVGTRRAREFIATRPDAVVICHNSVMAGDIFINHGVLLALMRARGRSAWEIYRNPVHDFIYLRDRIRYRGRTHRAVVALSQAAAAELRSTYGPVRPRIEVIPNGVDLDRFHPPTPVERRAARELLHLGDDERVAMFLGHEFTNKGVSFAIQGLLHAESVLLLVVGGTDEIIAAGKAEAEANGVAERVLFLGPRGDPTPFLRAADLFVLPSASEENALVVLEALASGLPVIATPVGFAPEVIVDGVNGFLVERTGQAVGERMQQLAALDDADLAKWRRRARESVEAYGWRGVAQRYLDLADELLAEREHEHGGSGHPFARSNG